MRRAAALFLIVASTLALTGVGGCDGKQLRSSSQAREYVIDVLHGNAATWDGLADDATLQARLAWERETRIASLGRRLEAGVDWTCDVADWTSEFKEYYENFQRLPPAQRAEVVSYFSANATPEEIEAVIDEVWALGRLEVLIVVNEVCI